MLSFPHLLLPVIATICHELFNLPKFESSIFPVLTKRPIQNGRLGDILSNVSSNEAHSMTFEGGLRSVLGK